jgi:hypothetical protein
MLSEKGNFREWGLLLTHRRLRGGPNCNALVYRGPRRTRRLSGGPAEVLGDQFGQHTPRYKVIAPRYGSNKLLVVITCDRCCGFQPCQHLELHGELQNILRPRSHLPDIMILIWASEFSTSFFGNSKVQPSEKTKQKERASRSGSFRGMTGSAHTCGLEEKVARAQTRLEPALWPRPCLVLSSPPPNRLLASHLGVLSLPKGLCHPLPQVSAQVPAPFGLVHWPFLTELKETPVSAGRHFGPRVPCPRGRSRILSTFLNLSFAKCGKFTATFFFLKNYSVLYPLSFSFPETLMTCMWELLLVLMYSSTLFIF